MLEKSLHKSLLKDYQTHQDQRHQLIGRSNSALRKSKQAIFHLHRGSVKKARATLDAVKKEFQNIEKTMLKKHPSLKQQGAYLAALEEFVEAELFYQALKSGKLTEIKGVYIPAEQYIGGISDMTGELTRQSVLKASEKKFNEVQKFAEIVESVVGALIEFDLTGSLRQKYDDAKRNLKRIESVLYDISLRE